MSMFVLTQLYIILVYVYIGVYAVRFMKTALSPPGSGLNDGQWHAIRLVAKENFAMLTIDGEEASAVRSTSPLIIATGGTYHLGGKGQQDKAHISHHSSASNHRRHII